METILNKWKFCRKKKKSSYVSRKHQTIFCSLCPNYRRNNIFDTRSGMTPWDSCHSMCLQPGDGNTPNHGCRQQKQQHTSPKPKITPGPNLPLHEQYLRSWLHTQLHPEQGAKLSMVSYRTNSKTLTRESPIFYPAQSWSFCALTTLQTSVK